MRFSLLFLLISLSIVSCTDPLENKTTAIQIIWTSKPVVTNKAYLDCIRKYITRMSHWNKCDTVTITMVTNYYKNFSMATIHTKDTEDGAVPDGYFIIDSTVCLLYTGFESAFAKRVIAPPESPTNAGGSEAEAYIMYDKETGDTQLLAGEDAIDYVEKHDRTPKCVPAVQKDE